jgi:hypothetical protein
MSPPSLRFEAIPLDNVAVTPDGVVTIVETMFASTVDPTGPGHHLAARIHPARAALLLRLSSGPVVVGRRTLSAASIEVAVNAPDGIVMRDFAELVEPLRALEATGRCETVRSSTIVATGFDPDAEPLVRELDDGTSVVVFAAMPPVCAQQEPMRSRFDLDSFQAESRKAMGEGAKWDDREVLVVPRPASEVIDVLSDFLAGAAQTLAPQPKAGFFGWFARPT